MQARLELRRSPSAAILAVFALMAALLLGGTLGYVLKPAEVVNTPARVVVVHDESALYSTVQPGLVDDQQCIWIGHRKSC